MGCPVLSPSWANLVRWEGPVGSQTGKEHSLCTGEGQRQGQDLRIGSRVREASGRNCRRGGGKEGESCEA